VTVVGNMDLPCPRCGIPLPIAVSAGPGVTVGDTFEVPMYVDELEQVPHYLTCTSREEGEE
jgi:hypothetical protein